MTFPYRVEGYSLSSSNAGLNAQVVVKYLPSVLSALGPEVIGLYAMSSIYTNMVRIGR